MHCNWTEWYFAIWSEYKRTVSRTLSRFFIENSENFEIKNLLLSKSLQMFWQLPTVLTNITPLTSCRLKTAKKIHIQVTYKWLSWISQIRVYTFYLGHCLVSSFLYALNSALADAMAHISLIAIRTIKAMMKKRIESNICVSTNTQMKNDNRNYIR